MGISIFRRYDERLGDSAAVPATFVWSSSAWTVRRRRPGPVGPKNETYTLHGFS